MLILNTISIFSLSNSRIKHTIFKFMKLVGINLDAKSHEKNFKVLNNKFYKFYLFHNNLFLNYTVIICIMNKHKWNSHKLEFTAHLDYPCHK